MVCRPAICMQAHWMQQWCTCCKQHTAWSPTTASMLWPRLQKASIITRRTEALAPAARQQAQQVSRDCKELKHTKKAAAHWSSLGPPHLFQAMMQDPFGQSQSSEQPLALDCQMMKHSCVRTRHVRGHNLTSPCLHQLGNNYALTRNHFLVVCKDASASQLHCGMQLLSKGRHVAVSRPAILADMSPPLHASTQQAARQLEMRPGRELACTFWG